ncbi:MAG TPA: tetratricopeptide repeat protein [Pyrinomonadaceae bacterium]|nr:tetratricopeptide repeat protein [Pyrinomonadaceae bacterium]
MFSRLRKVCATCLVLVVVVTCLVPVVAKDKWTSVRSENFLLVGNAGEKEIRQVSIKLEQFREVVSHLFTSFSVKTAVPTTVIVFKDDESYRPFKPNENTAGFFQGGSEVNYITLKLLKDANTDQDPFTIIFHEYTHLLVRNTKGHVPIWFNEGLAEYYSTFSVNDQHVVVGRPIARHVYLLRQNGLLPLRTLFQVDQKSPYYNESDKQGIFYAESWVLVHYLMLGNNGARLDQMSKFLELLANKRPTEEAFQEAFGMSVDNMEHELRAYIQRDRYPISRGSLAAKLSSDTERTSTVISEAEAQAYLGDLLLKSNRVECEAYLQRALALDPDLPMANASLGLLRVRQGRSEEARQSLERALSASSQNYLINYYYAYALSREGNRDMQAVMGFAPNMAGKMRAALKRAIELRPDFLESYNLLAFVNLVSETDLDETAVMLKKVLAASPERLDLAFMLAQVYIRQEDFTAARPVIDLLRNDHDGEMQQRGQRLLNQVVALEEHAERVRRERAANLGLNGAAGDGGAQEKPFLVRPYDPIAALRESLRIPTNGETQTQGVLTRIDCEYKDPRGIVFTIKVGDRALKLNTDDLRHVEFRSFSDDAHGHITCGPRLPENNVVVVYVAAADSRPKVDGLIKSVEFVPGDFKLKP